MCGVAAVAITLQSVSLLAQGFQARQQGRFQQGVSRFNARQLENEAQQVTNIGTEQENEQRRATAELLSRQRAQLGASGVELGSGSALQLQTDTQTLGEVDALRIRSTSGLRAESLIDQSELTRSQGDAAKRSGDLKFGASLLFAAGTVAASGVADKWFSPDSAIFDTGIAQGHTVGRDFSAFV